MEDDNLIRKIYCELLAFMGHEVLECATNGEEAINMFKNFSIKPDLIIIDYRLPIKNGLNVMKEILKQDRESKIMFASADNSIKEESLKSGAISFIEKPFNFTKLKEEITKLSQSKYREISKM
ncbi:MAG: response regulator [Promethearchaeota archaeon]